MERLRRILEEYWGFDDFRPLQAEAMRAALDERDSLVVLPTGGGKSLCYQAPALAMPGMAVVVSPLIALMKDQVDALADCGVPAACVNSTMTPDEKRDVAARIRSGELKILYLSPERLLGERTLAFLSQVGLSFIAIDEAHCISEWGHDFRPEYRGLRLLKETFPRVAIHAYTATATPRVRDDIVRELRLREPELLVGSFDRPNLVYRVRRRADLSRQVREVIARYSNDSGIIYCLRRSDVDAMAAELRAQGYSALPYHAGMEDEERRRNQEAFTTERARIIVATVAFGMGIDKSNVRYVIHAAAPKSLESYQQESGRAGRDGLEAECWLFHSAADFQSWRKLQSDLPPEAYEIAMKLLGAIDDYCAGTSCRHRALVEYFGQTLASESCGACDVCLGEIEIASDSLVVAQKILSCVVRAGEGYGGEYISLILAGSREERIKSRGHDRLSTHGILAEHDKRTIRAWIDQLVSQRFLEKEGEFNVLVLTESGREVLRGAATPKLLRPVQRARKDTRAAHESWDGVDRGLFDMLRAWRRTEAEERGVPPFVVFSDATLRDLARFRPSTLDALPTIRGIGAKKLGEYGEALLREINAYCQQYGVAVDAAFAHGS